LDAEDAGRQAARHDTYFKARANPPESINSLISKKTSG